MEYLSLDDLLHSSLFKQVLFDIQKESGRLLLPGKEGLNCPGNYELCDECDYLICCTKDDDELSGNICGECFAEHGACPLNLIPPPSTPTPPPHAVQPPSTHASPAPPAHPPPGCR